MDRRLVDIRHPDCKTKIYPKKLPKASVIIIFCNEAPSGLLRTVHSVVNRSPPEYLHEVVLVDDNSDRPELQEPLEKNISTSWPDGIVKLVRSPKRLGLIRAKILGAKESTGEVLVFLDAHCEANDYWLEPILARIQEKPNVVLCPAVDLIDDKNMEYSRNGGISVGGFTWSLHFTWRSVPEKEKKIRKSDADPVRSPTMAGGLLAVGRDFFFHIGAYDPGMFTWGGENLELSFRTWMCGGELEFLPCSRVGHIFRAAHPYKFDHSDSHGYNSKRLAEVWMDEYKRLFYNHRSDLRNSDAGNFTDRIELRKKLNCKSFKWYLDNVFPEQFIIDENSQAYGMVRLFSVRNPESNLCLDTLSRNHKVDPYIGVFPCSGGLSHNQMFALSQINELRMEEVCADVVGERGARVKLMDCHELRGNQLWNYNRDTKQLKHASGWCLDVGGMKMNDNIKLNDCSAAGSQKWEFEHVLKFI
ncbi:hypothetical protein HELRODRAFT_104138 [Helobdella robusta]|uniref:Polypeptide N-acetylgalactosaminyltransferase n=1 Tax=Helobdella robusta TaxID=6412 RepID=T1EDJ9_HELRO|nr:hypothetical protein HELRODRAFT_104138 [Helobdella robusta]ESN91925.1 hypothetical protein HELRODRAFT_104138 [Helobdella robusta]